MILCYGSIANKHKIECDTFLYYGKTQVEWGVGRAGFLALSNNLIHYTGKQECIVMSDITKIWSNDAWKHESSSMKKITFDLDFIGQAAICEKKKVDRAF